jgi:hypothetical protein
MLLPLRLVNYGGMEGKDGEGSEMNYEEIYPWME